MNLVNGTIISGEDCDHVLQNIDAMILNTLRKPPLDVELVIDACDQIVQRLDRLDIMKRLPELGISPRLASMYRQQVGQMLSAGAIRKRLRAELGEEYDRPRTLTYLHSGMTAEQSLAPLGVLFHITAGNVDGLPFISLLDGLLTGNINIVKLPKEEGGITISLLLELFKAAPALKEYVYVFDYSSKDIHAMRTLAAAADAIVIWGGDAAVKAVRALAEPNTRLIEWGHKLSFAYVTQAGRNRESLEKLALHICLTNQLFCSSCQGVFLDTDDSRELYAFCEEFLAALDRVAGQNPFAFDAAAQVFVQAQITLELYHRQIEARKTGERIFRGEHASVTACLDSELEASIPYRNPWVKPLKRQDIITLRRYKNHLQTAALLCAEAERAELSSALLTAGIVKISDGFDMSNYAPGEAHDGLFTLRCYMKSVSVQNN